MSTNYHRPPLPPRKLKHRVSVGSAKHTRRFQGSSIAARTTTDITSGSSAVSPAAQRSANDGTPVKTDSPAPTIREIMEAAMRWWNGSNDDPGTQSDYSLAR